MESKNFIKYNLKQLMTIKAEIKKKESYLVVTNFFPFTTFVLFDVDLTTPAPPPPPPLIPLNEVNDVKLLKMIKIISKMNKI